MLGLCSPCPYSLGMQQAQLSLVLQALCHTESHVFLWTKARNTLSLVFECANYEAFHPSLKHRIKQHSTVTLNTVLSGDFVLSEETNELSFDAVHTYLLHTKRLD